MISSQPIRNILLYTWYIGTLSCLCGTSGEKFSNSINNLGSQSLISASFPEIDLEAHPLQSSSVCQYICSGEESFVWVSLQTSKIGVKHPKLFDA